MSGFAIPLANNVYPAHFGQISQNLQTNMQIAAQGFSNSEYKKMVRWRESAVDGSTIKPEPDRDGDGHGWNPPQRRQRPAPPPAAHQLELLAGEGTLFDQRS